MWLTSDRAGFVSGHTMVVDGGFTTGSIEGAEPAAAGSVATNRYLREGGKRGVD